MGYANITADETYLKHGNLEKFTEQEIIDIVNTNFHINNDSEILQKRRKSLDLTDDRIKILIEGHPSPLHYLTGIYGTILNCLEIFENPLFVINVSLVSAPYCDQKLVEFLYYFLIDNKIDHICVNSNEDTRIFIKNFYIAKFGNWPEPNSVNKIYKKFLKYINNKDAVPTKKVYVSRKNVSTIRDLSETPEEVDLQRIDDENAIESFFRDSGFEIVYPENFKSFIDQINYFYEVKTIASISGGAATNLIFMQPETNVIELISPLYSNLTEDGIGFGPGFSSWVKAHHHFFSNVSYKQELNYIGIPNPEKKSKLLINKILNNKAAMTLIKEKNED